MRTQSVCGTKASSDHSAFSWRCLLGLEKHLLVQSVHVSVMAPELGLELGTGSSSWCLNIMIYFQSILLFVTVASSKNLVLVLEQLKGIMVRFITT